MNSESKLMLKEKMDNYAQYVQEAHTPHVSRKKQREMQRLMMKLKHPVR
jgi:hypothetical protein